MLLICLAIFMILLGVLCILKSGSMGGFFFSMSMIFGGLFILIP